MKDGFAFRRYLLEPRLATVSSPSVWHFSNIELIRWFSILVHAILFLSHFHDLVFALCLGKSSLILSYSHSHTEPTQPLIIIQDNSGILLLASLVFQSPLPLLMGGERLLLPLPYFSLSQSSVLGPQFLPPCCAMIIFLQVSLPTNGKCLNRRPWALFTLLPPEPSNKPNPCLPIWMGPRKCQSLSLRSLY